MDVQLAHLVLYAIATVAAVAWLAGLRFVIASARGTQPTPESRFDFGEAQEPALIQGTAEVDGEPESLATRAASMLAQGRIRPLGLQRIVERRPGTVVFEDASEGRASRPRVRRGSLRFTHLSSGRTRVEYHLEPFLQRGLLWGATMAQFLGLTAIVTGFWLIHTYVASNPNPAVRWQTMQMVQVVHFLWPPFLLGGLYRKQTTIVRDVFHTFCQNLPYYEA